MRMFVFCVHVCVCSACVCACVYVCVSVCVCACVSVCTSQKNNEGLVLFVLTRVVQEAFKHTIQTIHSRL